MRNFDKLFALPAIPDTISGKTDVAIKGQGSLLALVTGEGNTPELRGRALLALVAESAFDGGGVTLARLSADGLKGHKRGIVAALAQAGQLPACKGGKAPRPLTAGEVQEWVSRFADALGEVKERAPAQARPMDPAKLLARLGPVAARELAMKLLALTGGVVQAADAAPAQEGDGDAAPARAQDPAPAQVPAMGAALAAAAAKMQTLKRKAA